MALEELEQKLEKENGIVLFKITQTTKGPVTKCVQYNKPTFPQLCHLLSSDGNLHLTSWNDHRGWSRGHDVRGCWRHGNHIDTGSRNHGRH